MVEMDRAALERFSSAVTLSDMEIFVFPELLLAGALADIMSPIVWQWKQDPWFEGIEKLSEYRRILKVKQYIIDHFVFNLDLDTWGLTTKDRELARFSPYISLKELSASNALFGYEGDKYYFDIDIRKHFHLDQYTTDVIPYWKTETAEAMTAFVHKDGFTTGGGECVSFSLLYFAALYIIAGVPLERLYMLATPLHSQNFVAAGAGLLTNNRRIVTQNMWFNGTEMSFKARRALQNEKITMVAGIQGYVHTLYPKATMPPQAYQTFSEQLKSFLTPQPEMDMFYGFLRQYPEWQKLCQFQCNRGAVASEELYAIESNHSAMVSKQGRDKLLSLLPQDVFQTAPLPGRLVIGQLEEAFGKTLRLENRSQWLEQLKPLFPAEVQEQAAAFVEDLLHFCYIDPQLPTQEKEWVQADVIDLSQCGTREEIIDYLSSIQQENPTASLALMAYRDVSGSRWQPFLKAALERNPVSIEGLCGLPDEVLYDRIKSLGQHSIYDGQRLAQPDEVWNFATGDGVEKAICLWNVLISRHRRMAGTLELAPTKAVLCYEGERYVFPSNKGFAPATWDCSFLSCRSKMQNVSR